MYTEDDYKRDLMISKLSDNNSYEKAAADLRIRDYERGLDPDLRKTKEGRKIIKEETDDVLSFMIKYFLIILLIIVGILKYIF